MVGWTSNYQETLKELGLEDGDIAFPEGPDRGMTLLVGKYIARMRATLHTWFVNILQASALSPLAGHACSSQTLQSQSLCGCLRACPSARPDIPVFLLMVQIDTR